jgi:hypothetical protein
MTPVSLLAAEVCPLGDAISWPQALVYCVAILVVGFIMWRIFG